MKYIFFTLFIPIFFVSCSKSESQPEAATKLSFDDVKAPVSYTIKKGNHYSDQNQPQVLNRNSMSARVTFDSSAIYTSVDAVNQGDVNKLMGFSDCNNDHQQNSARLGWSWNGESLILYGYAYTEKKRIIKNLGSFALNKVLSCSIKAENNYFYFTVDHSTDSIPRYCADYAGARYKLFPYFGGDETAPHQISILIAED